MKNMRKIIAVFLSMAMLFTASTALASEKIVSVTYDRAKYVAVTGNAGSENAGFDASLMLVKKGADYNNLELADVGYIGQEEIDANGKYLFEFTFDGFTYDENGVVSNYELLLNVNGEDKTETITQSKVTSQMLSFDLDFDNFGEAVANITNTYGLKDVSYTLVVAFYDASNRLISVKKEQKYTGDNNVLTYNYDEIPQETSYAKGFLWENTAFLLPLAPSGSYDIIARSENRNATTMCISPGIDESERNFAWYDIPNIGGAKIQVAEKVTGTASDFNGESAKTFSAESGMLDTSKYNDLLVRPGSDNPDKYNFQDDNSWAKATVTGLKKGKEYVYRVGDKFGWFSKIYNFKTDAAPEDGFSFLVFADEHFQDTRYKDVQPKNSAKAFEYCSDPSMVFTLGDNVDRPEPEDGYTQYFAREFTNRVPMVSVPGRTHDMGIEEFRASVFGKHFNMPNQSETSGVIDGVCANYWYTYGDVLFIGLTDTWDGSAADAQFVKDACAANPDAKWRILFTHLPFDTDPAGDFTAYFNRLGEDYINECDIDMVMYGHLHRYYRTHQLINGVPVNKDVVNEVTDPEGVVYFSFNTGSYLSGAQEKFDYMAVADTEGVYGFSTNVDFHSYFTTVNVVTTDAETSLEVKAYRNTFNQASASEHNITNTELIDSYKITKTK